MRPALPLLSPPRTARRAILGALILGGLADLTLRDGPWGAGLLLWMAGFGVLIIALTKTQQRGLTTEGRVWLGTALIFAGCLAWRDAGLLHFFDLLAMLASLVLLALTLSGIPVASLFGSQLRDLVQAGLRSAFNAAFGVIYLIFEDAELVSSLAPTTGSKLQRFTKAGIIALPVLLIFTLLLAEADPVFGSLFSLPEINVELIASHVFVVGFFAWIVAGWLRGAILTKATGIRGTSVPLPMTLSITDVRFLLGALNLLFVAFVAVQIRWLFGGEALVLNTTGLSYAEYARHGFFELTCVAGLLLTLLVIAKALIPVEAAATTRSYQRLTIPLIVLLGAILCSAAARMQLYIQYYGISSDRFYASAFMLWLAVVFVLFAVTVLRLRPRAFATGVVVSAMIGLLGLNAINPDALVARANLARGEAGRNAVVGIDFQYLATLGGDAVPQLVAALTSPPAPGEATTSLARCEAAQVLIGRWASPEAVAMARNWFQWNLGRMRATVAMRANEERLRHLICPAVAPAVGP